MTTPDPNHDAFLLSSITVSPPPSFSSSSQGAKKTIQGDDAGWTDQKSAWVAAAAAGGCAVVTACFMPFLQGYTERKFADPALEASNPEVAQQGWQVRHAVSYSCLVAPPDLPLKQGWQVSAPVRP
jgi:hypothetical protein